LACCPQSNWQNNFRNSPKRKPGWPLKNDRANFVTLSQEKLA
jgi:hypothetical protein